MDKLYIIIPAYNEKENIDEVVKAWYPMLDLAGNDSRLIIINDGSTDNTLELLQEINLYHPKLIVVNKKNGGHGSAVYAGYKYALDQEADYIFQTDSDMQTLPSEFESFWKKRNDYSAIFGYRKTRGDGYIRSIIEKVVCLIVKLFFHVNVPDANAPYRLFNGMALSKYIEIIESDYFLPNILLTAFFVKNKENVCFLPITFLAREKGNQSINIKKIIRIGINSLRDFKIYNRKFEQYILGKTR